MPWHRPVHCVGSIGCVMCRRVHSGFRGIIRAHIRSSGTFALALVHSSAPSCSFALAWVHSDAPSGLRVHMSSRGFTRARLWVVGFIQVRVGSIGRV